MVNRNRSPRGHRARPMISRVDVSSSSTVLGVAWTLTPISEIGFSARPLHVESLLVSMVTGGDIEGAVAAGVVKVWAARTSAVVALTDAGVRTREVFWGHGAMIQVFRFVNINVGAGEALKLEVEILTESVSSPTWKTHGAYKIVYREVRQ